MSDSKDDLLKDEISLHCKDSWLSTEDIYYGIKYLNIDSEQSSIEIICKDIENKLISQRNLAQNNDYVRNLNNEAIDRIFDYTESDYVNINRELRTEQISSELDARNFMEFLNINGIIKALDNAPKADKIFYTFRTVSDFDLDNGKALSDLSSGDTFIDQGFMSSSWKPSYVEGTEDCCIIIIEIPKNMKYLSVESISKKHEDEILTYPGMEYRIKKFADMNLFGYKEMKIVKVKVFHCEIIGNYWVNSWSDT